MNLYKKINDYLLHNHPNIWITRIHLFVPIGLGLFVFLFALNAFGIGYNPQNDLPENVTPILLMIIPLLIFIVYWFVFQARYNVEKSGGKLSVIQEYINYFIYFFMFALAYGMIIAIPLSNEYKVAHSVSVKELKKDIEILNLGYSVVNHNNSLTQEGNIYSFYQDDFTGNNYYYDDYAESEFSGERITVNKSELIKIIDNYILAFNKFTAQEKINDSAEGIMHDNLEGNLGNKDYEFHYYGYYYDDTPKSKIHKMGRFHSEGWYHNYIQKEVLYVLSVIFAMLALLVWLFKQIHWKYFVFGIIAHALTPLVVAILLFFLMEMFDYGDDILAILMMIGYVVFAIIIGFRLSAKQSNHTAVVMTMFLQSYIPFLPVVIWVLFDEHLRNEDWEIVYYIGWVLGLISIGSFKYIYKRMRLLPAKK